MLGANVAAESGFSREFRPALSARMLSLAEVNGLEVTVKVPALPEGAAAVGLHALVGADIVVQHSHVCVSAADLREGHSAYVAFMHGGRCGTCTCARRAHNHGPKIRSVLTSTPP